MDCFINIGGSIFIQNDQWKKDDRRLLVDIAKDKPKFMLGCNFGPYYEQEYLQFYHEWLKQFNDICFRDKYSYQLFSDLNNTRVAHDIVLNQNRIKSFTLRKKRLGVSVIDLNHRKDLRVYEENYINYIVKNIEMFLKDNFLVTLYSFCQNENDDKMIEKILNKLGDNSNKVKVVYHKDNLKSFVKDFSKNDYIIGTRFHSIILSIVNGQKVLPLIYNEKTKNMLDDLTLDVKYVMIDDKLCDNEISFDAFQCVKVAKENNTASQQFSVLDEYLK